MQVNTRKDQAFLLKHCNKGMYPLPNKPFPSAHKKYYNLTTYLYAISALSFAMLSGSPCNSGTYQVLIN